MQLNNRIDSLENFGQQQAIRKHKRCVVLARPGTGKTHTLILKIAYLLGHVINLPEKLACITFMNDAVNEIIDRLEILGIENDQRLFAGTVHRFCFAAILHPFKDLFLTDLPSPLLIADLEIQKECLREANEAARTSILLQQLQRFRRDQILNKPFQNRMQEDVVLDLYIAGLRKRGMIDFDDIANYSYYLIKNYSVVRDYIVSCFPWIVIDEYQDLGAVFNALVLELVEETEINFLIVGDHNQSIMGFQGAEPKYLRNLAARPDIEVVELRITRRCLPHIVSLANLLVSDPIETHISHDQTRKAVAVYCRHGIEEQIEHILETIKTETARGTQLGMIAILCRENQTILKITEALTRHDIQYSGSKDERYERSPFIRWLEDMAAWAYGGWKHERPRFKSLHNQLQNFFHDSGLELPFENDLSFQERLFHMLLETGQQTILVRDWVNHLLSDSGLYLGLLIEAFEKNDTYFAQSFNAFLKEVSAKGRLAFMKVADFALCGRLANSVFISTLHSSKGLEFDTVIMPALEEGRLPIWHALQGGGSEDQVGEERRLLYVGITRAKFNIHLLYSGFYYDHYQRRFNNGPSRFLREIGLIQ